MEDEGEEDEGEEDEGEIDKAGSRQSSISASRSLWRVALRTPALGAKGSRRGLEADFGVGVGVGVLCWELLNSSIAPTVNS
jgi:hypothetical protein